jgi:hypothetical protein
MDEGTALPVRTVPSQAEGAAGLGAILGVTQQWSQFKRPMSKLAAPAISAAATVLPGSAHLGLHTHQVVREIGGRGKGERELNVRRWQGEWRCVKAEKPCMKLCM